MAMAIERTNERGNRKQAQKEKPERRDVGLIAHSRSGDQA
jgi:hypothetical protein